MKKKSLFLVLIAHLSIMAMAQDTSSIGSIALAKYDAKVVEGLVSLAMENPQIKSAENTSMQFKYAASRSKTAWLNQITASGNLNEISIKNFSGNTDPLRQNLLYPRYNVGVIVPVGLFVNNRKQTQSDMYKYQSATNEIEVVKQNIRHDVLVGYENYLMNQNLVSLQYAVLKSAEILFIKTEDKFGKGEISLEAYTVANKSFVDEKVKTLTLERNLRVAEADLEALVGMKMSAALDRISGKKPEQRTRR
jgi:outer membrane protein TolC